MDRIEKMLREAVGFDQEALSSRLIRQCIDGRMFLLGLREEQDYLAALGREPEELADLINSVVVPETWFFRDHAPFEFLRLYIREEWLPRHAVKTLRILSIPCSTGEEPYSIAISLKELGLERRQFKIDAVDISERALERARLGLYNRNSFRGARQDGLMRFFEEVPGGFQLEDGIRRSVHFIRANAMKFAAEVSDGAYDIVFCRNLLIYLNEESRRTLLSQLDRALVPNGLFFLGHAEAPCMFLPVYEAVAFPGSFAVRKRTPSVRSPELVAAPLRKWTAPAMPAPIVVKPSPAAALAAPESFGSLLSDARQCADRGDYPKARMLCSQVLRHNPACTEAFYISGVAALADGNEEEAMNFFHKTLYLEPDHEEALVHLSLLMEKAGNAGQAARYRRMMERGARSEPADMRGHGS